MDDLTHFINQYNQKMTAVVMVPFVSILFTFISFLLLIIFFVFDLYIFSPTTIPQEEEEGRPYTEKKVTKPNRNLNGQWIGHKSYPNQKFIVHVHGNSCSLYRTEEDYREQRNKVGSPATRGICKKFIQQ
jgi:hypothetical protein